MPLGVILLLALHAWLGLSASLEKSPTADEVAHLLAGQVYWEHGDYRLQPENGNLTQRWEGLPAALAGRTLPPAESEAWRNSDVWTLGDLYFHRLGNPLESMLFQARAMNLVWSLATGLLVFLWARRLHGLLGAFVSLFFFALSPAFLAHGPLASSDMCMTFFFLACTGAFWKVLRHPGRLLLAGSALLFGLACVAKFSAVLLIPIFLLLGAASLVSRKKDTLARRFRQLALVLGIHALAAWGLIWLFYGFKHGAPGQDMPAFASYYRSWDMIRDMLGGRGEFLWSLSKARILPDPFVFGFAHVVALAETRAAFLNGHYSLTGWLGFFPFAFVVKSTLALLFGLCLFCLGALRWLARRLHRGSDLGHFLRRASPWLPLVVLFLVYWAASLSSHLNIGHRHLLPIYPPLFIALGALGAWSRERPRLFLPLLVLLLALQAYESFSIRPHYLAFFNRFSGGPALAYRHLVDSSLDWGQDLPGLAKRLEELKTRELELPVYLSYFGTANPAHYGIQAASLPWIPRSRDPELWLPLKGGLYCVSATMLQQVYSRHQATWTLELEKEYQDLRALEPGFYAFAKANSSPQTNSPDSARWLMAWDRFNELRFARLCHVLRARQPNESIGYSILLYRLSDEEVNAACHGPWSQWQALLEKNYTP